MLSAPADEPDLHLEPGIAEQDLRNLFGAAWPAVSSFERLLREHGETRGLIGPREVPKLWSRHLVNSAALGGFLPAQGSVADVGSGAGLPGIVLAALRPELAFHLVEPMQRRIAWLEEVVETLELGNVELHRARAADLHGRLRVDVVTARAVAEIGKLAAWCLPLLRPGGRLLALKGRSATQEVSAASRALGRLGVARTQIHAVDVLGASDPTTVVELTLGRPSRR